MKWDKTKYILIAIIICAWLYSEYHEYINHQAFFTDMRSFTDVGGRFTADNGIDLCELLNKHNETDHGKDPVDCTFLINKNDR